MARPSGVAFDETIGCFVLPEELSKTFLSENVYIKGVTEDEPILVYFTKERTVIPSIYKKPPQEEEWIKDMIPVEVKNLSAPGRELYLKLSRPPADVNQIAIEVQIPLGNMDGLIRAFMRDSPMGIRYERKGKEHNIVIDITELKKRLNRMNVKERDKIIIELTYPV
jgi:hypothetical protein